MGRFSRSGLRDVPGLIRVIIGTDPAAGVEITETVPVGRVWRLLGWRAVLVADATVTTRVVTIVVDDGVDIYAQAGATAGHLASQNRSYVTPTPDSYQFSGASGGFGLALPSGIILLPGHRIRTLTENFQAADNWSAPVFQVEEWSV